MNPRAAALIDTLRLRPHPEGGFYREIHRSASIVHPADDRAQRAAVTSIYFLLAAGQHSCWHRVESDEIWHFYEGDPLALYLAPPSLERMDPVILSGVDGPGVLVHTVAAGWWQAAQPRGAYCLAGCTVAPGFEFADFTFLRDDPKAAARLHALDPALAALA